MSRGRKIAIAFIAITVSIGALQFWLWKSPLVTMTGGAPGGEIFDQETPVGRVFADVQTCGEQQKNLYICIESYREKHGRLPEDMDALINSVHETMAFRNCPAGLSPYVVHFENYGKPDAVLIEEAENKHPTAFKLWVRGIQPQVQTMGDGTIHLFQNGKLATINARKE